MSDKNWTIMVYMSGDNNLSIEMVYALEQLKAVTQNTQNYDLFVYFDGLSGDVPTLYCDFSNNLKDTNPANTINFYQSYKIPNKLIDVKDEFNENSAAVDNIINFVDWCIKKDTPEEIENKKYAFIFSGHSFGFINWGLFKDEKSAYSMSHRKLKYLFERITSDQNQLLKKAEIDENRYRQTYEKPWTDKRRKERTTVILGKKLDILGFDSCVMSTLELGCQFRKFAKTMVASEGSIPTAGWNYAQILKGRISKHPKSETNEIAVSFVDEFIKQQNKFAIADISVDISAWDLEKIPELETAFEIWVESLNNCLNSENEPTVFEHLKRLLIYTHWKCQTYMLEQHIDLGDFCHILVEELEILKSSISESSPCLLDDLEKSSKGIIQKIQECILITGFSGSDFQFSTGISLFFPWSLTSYYSAREDYEKLSFIKHNNAGIKWNKFLKEFLENITLRRSTPLVVGLPNEILHNSIVYESYTNMEFETKTIASIGYGTKQPPNTGRQPPNTGRQPPNTGRQPPNTGRMLNDMNYFFSRFTRLKNFECNWNRTGFRSRTVNFKIVDEQIDGDVLNDGSENNNLIVIPRPRSLENKIAEIFYQLKMFGENFNCNVEKYLTTLRDLFDNSDETTIKTTINSLELNSITSVEELITILEKSTGDLVLFQNKCSK